MKIAGIDHQIIVKGIKFLHTNNINDFVQKTKSVIERESRIVKYNHSYNLFLKKNKLSSLKIAINKKNIKQLKYQPKISILMPTYNSPHKFFKMNIESVINQIYQNWELCIADDNSSDKKIRDIIKTYSQKDKRIKYIFRNENGHISQATNSALKLANGEFVALLDHDDILYPNTLSECVKKLNENPDTELIYTDEDKINVHEKRSEPHFKPDWSPETLLSGNYITHFTIIKKKLIDKVGGFRTGYEGAQDLDLFLRITELTDKIEHIPKVLYSWRTVETSTASKNSNAKADYAYANGVKSVDDAFKRRGLKANVEMGDGRGLYQYNVQNENKNIDFFILDNKTNIKNNLNKILNINYQNSKIETFSNQKLGEKIFNFIKNSKSNYILFLDNNCFIDPKVIETNLGFFKIKPIKMVTNKITNNKNKIYKTGIIITKDKNNQIKLLDAFQNMIDGGYFNFNYSRMTKNYSATSLLGTTIDTVYFKSKNIDEIKDLTNFKEIGIYLSYIVSQDNNRIVYNPSFPILYESDFHKDPVSNKIIEISRKIIKNKYDKNYNQNLTTEKIDFGLNI